MRTSPTSWTCTCACRVSQLLTPPQLRTAPPWLHRMVSRPHTAMPPRNSPIRFLTELGMRAATDGDGSLSRSQFVSGVLWELGVAFCCWNTQIEWTVADYFALTAGWAFMPGVERPMAEVGAEVT
jgi:hypothetical protein